MLEGEQQQVMRVMNNMQEQSMQMSQQDAESASNMNQDQMVNETHGRM